MNVLEKLLNNSKVEKDYRLILECINKNGTKNITEDDLKDKKIIEILTDATLLNINIEKIGYINSGAITVPEFGTPQGYEIAKMIEPKTFDEVLCAVSLEHGVDIWHGNIKNLIINKVCKITQVPCYREHILETLIGRGCEENEVKALKFFDEKNNFIINTEIINLMRQYKVPDYYIECCKKAKYIISKEEAYIHTLIVLIFAYFKLYCPIEYYKAYFSVKNDVNCDKYLDMNVEQLLEEIKALKDKIANNIEDIDSRNLLVRIYAICEMKMRNITL